MKFLCHAGPWSDDYFRFLVKNIDQEADCKIVSGHKQVDKTLLVKKYYELLKLPVNSTSSPSDEELDIIARCRLLRALSMDNALHHLNSMRQAIQYVFDIEKPDITITETIDSFIIDLFCKESEKRGIPCIGLVTVFVNGLSRISIRGEYNKCRNVLDEEVSKVLSTLECVDYLPAFVAKDSKRFRYSVIRRWARNAIKIPYFSLKRWTSGDYFNYHYWHSIIICKSWFNWFPKIDIGTPNWESELNAAPKPVVYLPLQMFPEATIDYWCDDVSVIEYERVLLETVKKFSGITFLVKEHPNVLGHRKSSFYKALKSLGNIIVCPTEVPSNSLEPLYDAVLVWTGTVGFEAAIRGKALLAMSKPYYLINDTDFFRIDQQSTEKSILEYIENFKALDNKKELVKHVLEGCIKGKVQFDGTWREDNSSHREEALKVAQSLKDYINEYVFPKR